MKLNQLVSVIDGQPLASTEVIARGMRAPHRSVFRLVMEYEAELARFGEMRFEIAAVKKAGARGTKYSKFALLNEQHAALLISLMRNTPEVMAFKVRLISEFYRMRDALNQRAENLWRQMQELIAREVDSKVRASFGSHLMHERKREIPLFTGERDKLQAAIQPLLRFH